MSRIAVIGSGPGAMYTIKYLLKHSLSKLKTIDIRERLSAPFGLVRFGVAPDHKEVKEVANEFTKIVSDHSSVVKLHLNRSVSGLDEFSALQNSYDAILVATGAQSSNRLPFSDLPGNTMSAQDFVLWYNGHPEYVGLQLPDLPRDVSIVGHGNVAFDVARMLSKSPEELSVIDRNLVNPEALAWLLARQGLAGPLSVSLLGRGGYLRSAFTNKEFRELTLLDNARCFVKESELDYIPLSKLAEHTQDRAKLRGINILEKCLHAPTESRKNSVFLRFFTKPVRYVESGLEVTNRMGAIERIPGDLGIESIGFRVIGEQFGLPMDPQTGGIANVNGRVGNNVYVAGWSKRGPRGVIAANIPCCIETAETIFRDLEK